MNKVILEKYLSNKSNIQEFEKLLKWLRAKEDGEKSRSWILEDWESTDGEVQDLNPIIFSVLLDEIHRDIKLENLSKENKKPKFRKFNLWFHRLTTGLLLPLSVANFFC